MRQRVGVASALVFLAAACQQGSGGGVNPVGALAAATASTSADASFSAAAVNPGNAVTSDELYKAISWDSQSNTITSTTLRARIKEIGQLTFPQFYNLLLKSANNTPIQIDSILSISSAVMTLQGASVQITALGNGQATLADFWAAEGVDPTNISSSDIAAAMQAAANFASGAVVPQSPQEANQLAAQAAATEQNNLNQIKGVVSATVDPACGQTGHLPCAPATASTLASPKNLTEQTFAACNSPTGLAMKHNCTVAAAIGGATILVTNFAVIGGDIGAAGLVCAAQSPSPTAPSCDASNTTYAPGSSTSGGL